MIHQRHRQTDSRRTDRQTDDMQSQYRALHYSASRGKNMAYVTPIQRVQSLYYMELLQIVFRSDYTR